MAATADLLTQILLLLMTFFCFCSWAFGVYLGMKFGRGYA